MKTSTNQQFITNERGQKVAVIIPLIDFEKLQEDIHDLSVIAQRKNEPIISYATLKARLKR